LHNPDAMAEADLTFLAGQHVPRCTHRIDKHFRDYATLQFGAKGAVSLWIDDDAYALNGRWFWSAWNGPRVRFRPAEDGGTWHHRYIAFRGPRVRRWTDDGLFPVLPQPAPAGARRWAGRFDELLDASRRPRRWTQRRAVNVLEGMLIELAEARDQPATPPAALDRVRATLRAAVDLAPDAAHEPAPALPDYAALAESAGLSERSLRRAFRKRFGTSPHQYLIEARVGEAMRLLLETDWPIKRVAASLGYADVFYFTRQFRRHAGVSPAAYRRSREG
jgi:AraC-like DNA-binding protein